MELLLQVLDVLVVDGSVIWIGELVLVFGILTAEIHFDRRSVALTVTIDVCPIFALFQPRAYKRK